MSVRAPVGYQHCVNDIAYIPQRINTVTVSAAVLYARNDFFSPANISILTNLNLFSRRFFPFSRFSEFFISAANKSTPFRVVSGVGRGMGVMGVKIAGGEEPVLGVNVGMLL